MNELTHITIAVSESKGPIPPRLERISDETGEATYRTEGLATQCPECDKAPIAGETITKILGTWFHVECGAKVLNRVDADRAWMALGQQLERAPSRFTNAETKAITRNLLRIAGAYVTLAARVDDDYEPEWTGADAPTRLRVIDGGDEDLWSTADPNVSRP